MAGGITPEFLDELKFKCDIVSVISQYVPLTKKGGRYFGCCPFHNEKTASFCVNQASSFYHCFGCGASGDAVKFIMEIESVSFIDAVKLLADKAGMQLPEFKLDPDYQKKKETKDTLKLCMRDAARFYRNNLLKFNEGKLAREYLSNRGINEEVCMRYGLGLSLDYDGLQAYLRLKGYTAQNLKDCGLVNGDKLGDAFANRIIVPIFNSMNEVVAFGGRIYRGEQDAAKYKNSTNTPLFDKGRTVYGINYVKKDKQQSGGYNDLILVEGYMDVISLGAAGIRNAVAGMGTALTEGQAAEIKRLVSSLYVCYDGDTAGRKAAIKNAELLANTGLDIKIVALPVGADPDDTVRKFGYEGFMKYIAEALPLIDYKLKLCKEAYDVKSVNGRAKYVTAALRVIKDIVSVAEREVYLNVVSDISGVSVKTLHKDMNQAEQASRPDAEKKEAVPAVIIEGDGKNLRAARFVLNKLLLNASCANHEQISEAWFTLDIHKKVLQFVKKCEKGKVVAGDLFGDIGGDGEIDKIFDVNLTFDSGSKETEYFYDCVSVIANDFLENKVKEMNEIYKTLTAAEDKRNTLMKIQEYQKKQKSKNISDKLSAE